MLFWRFCRLKINRDRRFVQPRWQDAPTQTVQTSTARRRNAASAAVRNARKGKNMNFTLIFSILVLVTGSVWCADKLFFLPRRRRLAAGHADAQTQKEALRRPVWLEYSAGFFPVLLAVF